MSRCLSAYARQFLELMQKPDVDLIEGLSPAISIEQKTTRRIRAPPSAPSPRSTTICACSGRASACPIRPRPACRSKARPCRRWSTASWRCRKARGSLLAPIVRGRKGEYRKELAELQKQRLPAREDRRQVLRDRQHSPTLDKKMKHDIDVVVDRIVGASGLGTRLADSLETALKLADGIAIAELRRSRRTEADSAADDRTRSFLAKFACPVSGFTIPEIEPRLFSFNNPHGACPACDGLGTQAVLRSRAGRPRTRRKSLARRRDRAVGADRARHYYAQTLEALARALQCLDQHAVEGSAGESRATRFCFGSGETTIDIRL